MNREALKTLTLALAIAASALQAIPGLASNGTSRLKAVSQKTSTNRTMASAANAPIQSFQFRLVVDNHWSQFRLERENGSWNLGYVSNFEKTRILKLKPREAQTLLTEASRSLAADESISRCSGSYLQLEGNPSTSGRSKAISYACWNSSSANGKQVNGLFDSLARTLRGIPVQGSGKI